MCLKLTEIGSENSLGNEKQSLWGILEQNMYQRTHSQTSMLPFFIDMVVIIISRKDL